MYIADLHIHSKYSRATSRECVPEHLDLWARRKGIHILGTGDFTHPAWRQELKEKLVPAEEGLYVLKKDIKIRDSITTDETEPRFVISGEISSIYKKNGKTRKVHNVILLPGLEEAEALSRRLEAIGNIHSDGRPILGLDSRDLLEITLETCPQAIFIPAHIWTPHFSLFGAFSGFDTIEECFEDLTGHIHALETGLSSDPPMNWRLSALDSYHLVSNSDAHSPSKLGREANLLDIELSYRGLYQAIQQGDGLKGTIEFFPEEGKYHMDGHRKCDLCLSPVQTDQYGGKCPICGRKITIGVLHRVEQLADRPEGYERAGGLQFESLVPLPEVIAASTDKSAASVKVQRQYEAMLQDLGAEFSILRDIPLEEIKSCAGPCIEEGIRRLRQGKVQRIPGFDGEYGKIKIIDKQEIAELCGQMSLFESIALPAGAAKKAAKKTGTKKAKTESAADAAGPHPVEIPKENGKQQEAITAEDPVIAVIAGPGTGKTYTLTHRIAHLIQEKKAQPTDIMAVTFTNKAAAEMKQRLETLLGKKPVKQMKIGTFHSLCLTFLQEKRAVILASEAQCLDLAALVLKKKGISMTPVNFLRKVSAFKTGMEIDSQHLHPVQEYCKILEERGLSDFDDLLMETLSHEEDRDHGLSMGENRWIFVDEFQDINNLQYDLIDHWKKKARALFVIGDPDQSIYGFRGSDPYCFDRLIKDALQIKTIYLDQNYRSAPEILNCALPVISCNRRERSQLKPLHCSGEPVRLVTAGSSLGEAIFLAKEINHMTGGMDMMDAQNYGTKREKHRSFSDIAILYRTNYQAKLIEKCLRKESIPYIVSGKQDYLQDEVVKGAIAFFRALAEKQPDQIFYEIGSILFETAPQASMDFLKGAFEQRISKEKPFDLLQDWGEKAGFAKHEPLNRLAEMAVFYDHMEAFLQNLLLGEEQDLRRSSSGKLYDAGAVSLMTFHGAKGLEFPIVFLCGLTQNHIPMKEDDLQEERRLFYVGMTRAQEELILLTYEEPSPFLAEIPRELLQCERSHQKKPEDLSQQLSLFD